MAEREERITTALTAIPSATAGRTMLLRFAPRPSLNGVKPPEGNHFHFKENNRIIMVPSQKLGIDMPRSPVTVTRESGSLFLLQAAQYPMGTPTSTAMSRLKTVSSRVTGRRDISRESTGWLEI